MEYRYISRAVILLFSSVVCMCQPSASELPSLCYLEPRTGMCQDKIPRWYYSLTSGTCKPFFYTGCGRNMNNFETREQCEGVCAIIAKVGAVEGDKRKSVVSDNQEKSMDAKATDAGDASNNRQNGIDIAPKVSVEQASSDDNQSSKPEDNARPMSDEQPESDDGVNQPEQKLYEPKLTNVDTDGVHEPDMSNHDNGDQLVNKDGDGNEADDVDDDAVDGNADRDVLNRLASTLPLSNMSEQIPGMDRPSDSVANMKHEEKTEIVENIPQQQEEERHVNTNVAPMVDNIEKGKEEEEEEEEEEREEETPNDVMLNKNAMVNDEFQPDLSAFAAPGTEDRKTLVESMADMPLNLENTESDPAEDGARSLRTMDTMAEFQIMGAPEDAANGDENALDLSQYANADKEDRETLEGIASMIGSHSGTPYDPQTNNEMADMQGGETRGEEEQTSIDDGAQLAPNDQPWPQGSINYPVANEEQDAFDNQMPSNAAPNEFNVPMDALSVQRDMPRMPLEDAMFGPDMTEEAATERRVDTERPDVAPVQADNAKSLTQDNDDSINDLPELPFRHALPTWEQGSVPPINSNNNNGNGNNNDNANNNNRNGYFNGRNIIPNVVPLPQFGNMFPRTRGDLASESGFSSQADLDPSRNGLLNFAMMPRGRPGMLQLRQSSSGLTLAPKDGTRQNVPPMGSFMYPRKFERSEQLHAMNDNPWRGKPHRQHPFDGRPHPLVNLAPRFSKKISLMPRKYTENRQHSNSPNNRVTFLQVFVNKQHRAPRHYPSQGQFDLRQPFSSQRAYPNIPFPYPVQQMPGSMQPRYPSQAVPNQPQPVLPWMRAPNDNQNREIDTTTRPPPPTTTTTTTTTKRQTSRSFPRVRVSTTRPPPERFPHVEFTQPGIQERPATITSRTDATAGKTISANFVCFLPVDTGSCKSAEAKWFFNYATSECEIFIYGGCGGNENRFISLQDCQAACTSTTQGSNTPDPDGGVKVVTETSFAEAPARGLEAAQNRKNNGIVETTENDGVHERHLVAVHVYSNVEFLVIVVVIGLVAMAFVGIAMICVKRRFGKLQYPKGEPVVGSVIKTKLPPDLPPIFYCASPPHVNEP